MEERTIKVEMLQVKKRKYPSIRLKGLWLEEAGIRYGEHIKVVIEDNYLKIAPVK